MVVEGVLSEGHARAILQAPTEKKMIGLARMVKAKQLSVRETERRARQEAAGGATAKKGNEKSPEVTALIEKMQRTLGARVDIKDKKGKGRIEISYTSYDELDAILNRIF